MGHTLRELTELVQGKLIGDPNFIVESLAELAKAGPTELSFFSEPKFTSGSYKKAFEQTNAGAVLVDKKASTQGGAHYIVCESPSDAFQKALMLFAKEAPPLYGWTGVHPSAVVHESVTFGEGTTIGPNTTIDHSVKIGQNCVIGPGCYIGNHVTIADNSHLHANVTIRESCQLGKDVIIQPGAVIGSCGFGYHTNAQGQHEKLLQLGIVVIEDNVEVGANTTIDRARFGKTRISTGTKIDNLVQVAHGVDIGPHNFLVAQSAIAGSSSTGSHVIIGGQAGVTGHVNLGNQVAIAATSAVLKSIPKAGQYGGIPARPLKQYQRAQAQVMRLDKTTERIKKLEAQVCELEKKLQTQS